MDAVQRKLIYRIQPEDLERNGYVVVVQSDQVKGEIANAIARKKNESTQIFDMTALKNIGRSKEMRGEIRPPSILYSLAAQSISAPILAQRRGRKPHLLFLYLITNQDQTPYWVAIDTRYIEELMRLSGRFMRMLLPKSEWARLCDELQCAELASV